MSVKLLSLEEAAAFLKMDAKEIRALVTSGELPCIYQGTRMVFEHSVLDNWYTNRLVNRLPIKQARNAGDADQELRLADYCSLEIMEPSLPGKTKPAILRALTELSERSGFLYNPEEFLENLRQREEISPTAMAEGIALCHPQTRDEYTCEQPFIAVGKTTRPVFFGEANGVPTDIFFVICSADPNEHIQMLAKLCMAVGNDKFLSALREAATPEEMLEAMQSA